MVSASWSFVSLGKRAAHHDRVCATSQRLANVAASAHPAVSDDRHISRCLFEVSIARCRAIDRGSHLGHTEPEHTTRSASRSGSHANQYCSRPAFHNLESYVVTDCVSHD